MNAYILRNILFPIHERMRGRTTLSELQKLEAWQRLTSDELLALAVGRCRKILHHAGQEVPYWSALFAEAGFSSEDFTSFDDLKKLPVMTKADVRANQETMLVPGWKERMVINHTGGSTGHPLTFYCSRERETVQNAAKLRSRHWWGWQIGEKSLDIWGQPLALTPRERLRRTKDRIFLNQRYLSAFSMSLSQSQDYVKIINDYRPALIYGYATAIYQLALLIKDNPALQPTVAPKVIITTAEMLHDYQREMIQYAFGCPVAEEYGAHDGGLMAHRCPSGGYHILSDLVYLETDEDGSALVTSFDSFGMPFIRYRIGDRVVLSGRKCSCGLPFPLLEEVCGREYDMVVSSNGKKIHGAFFHYMFKSDSRVRQFQVIQNHYDQLEIRIVTDESTPFNGEDRLRERICHEFETPLEITFRYVDAIEPESSGKYRWIICKVRG